MGAERYKRKLLEAKDACEELVRNREAQVYEEVGDVI